MSSRVHKLADHMVDSEESSSCSTRPYTLTIALGEIHVIEPFEVPSSRLVQKACFLEAYSLYYYYYYYSSSSSSSSSSSFRIDFCSHTD